LSFLDNTSDTSVLPVHGVPDIAILIIVFLGFDLIMFLFLINRIKTMSNKKYFSIEEAKRIGEALGLVGVNSMLSNLEWEWTWS
jgi:hypothetical protein